MLLLWHFLQMGDCMCRVGLRVLCIVWVTTGHPKLLFLISAWPVVWLFRQTGLYMSVIVLERFFGSQHLVRLSHLQRFQRVSRHFTWPKAQMVAFM
tara:strand:- start:269 stop:556 length:288 start_codon:yes stop_codon:yes gene_type:complete